eukprot:maker-scaffold245_size240363-snap-gene-1.27 protein:Tk06009 transcript:maker-scaffold245_size240363-snap-gene-1.27-mRNA-1 annotation:"ankyrin repeat protein"
MQSLVLPTSTILTALLIAHSPRLANGQCGENLPIDGLADRNLRTIPGDQIVVRVVGASEEVAVSPKIFPWLVSVGKVTDNGWVHFCGATIISSTHILTAAHCTVGTGELLLRFGDTDLGDSQDDGGMFTRNIYKTHVHPKYKKAKNEAYYDVAIWEIKPGIQFNSFVRPICIPQSPSADVDQQAGVSQFGAVKCPKVFYANLCEKLYGKKNINTNTLNAIRNLIPDSFQSNIICAGAAFSGTYGSCEGDSGSPLFQFSQTELRFIQQGIVSGGVGSCGDPRFPSIYVRLEDPEIWEFINNIISGRGPNPRSVSPPKPAVPSASEVALDPLSRSNQEGKLIAAATNAVNNCKSINQLDRQGRSLLWKTAEMGVFSAAKMLVEGHADLNAPDQEGMTPLHVASAKGFMNMVKLLVGFNAQINVTDQHRRGPLSHASSSGNAAIALQLFEAGADINEQDDEGNTPLHHALKAGHNEVAMYLLSLGAKPEIKNQAGLYPIHLAARYSSDQVLNRLKSMGVDTNPLMENGFCPLSLASVYGNKKAVQFLVEKAEADLTTLDYFGQTPLLAAASSGHDDIVQYYLSRGTNQINQKDAFGQSPLHVAAKFGRTSVVETLLTFGANKRLVTDQGQSAKDLAIQNGHFELAELLK